MACAAPEGYDVRISAVADNRFEIGSESMARMPATKFAPQRQNLEDTQNSVSTHRLLSIFFEEVT